MLQGIRKFLKYFLIFVSALLLVVVLGLTWALQNPKAVWQLAEQHLLPKDMHVTWSHIELEVKHLTGLNFFLDWEITDLLVTKLEPALQVPIDHIHIQASIFPRSQEQKVIFHQLLVQAAQPLRFHPSENPKPTVQKSPFQTLQDVVHYVEIFQKYAALQNVDIDMKEFRLEEKDDLYKKFSFSLQQKENGDQPQELKFGFNSELPGQQVFIIKATGQLLLPSKQDPNLWLKSQVLFSGLGVEGAENVNMNYSDKKTEIKITGPISYKNKKLNMKSLLAAEINMNAAGADLDLKADITGLPGNWVKVNSLKAKMHTPFEKNQTLSSGFSNFSLQVPIQIFFIDPDMAKPLAESCQCQIPEVILGSLSGKVWLANIGIKNKEKKPVLQADLKLQDVNNKLISLSAAGSVQIDLENQKYDLRPSINTKATVNSFQGLRRFLDAKGVLIPAPLDVLEGQIQFKLQGPVATEGLQYIFPALTTMKLTSKRQIVDIQSDTKMALNKDFKAADIKVSVLVNQLQLELPPLDPIKGKPRIATDQRILKSKIVKKPSQFKLTVAVDARTTQAGSVKLLSQYFEPYLPVTFNFHQVEGQKNSGLISLEPFDVHYVRRTVRVEKMQIALPKNNSKFFEVDGRLQIKQTQYTVYIDIQGPSNAPNITFSSVPYLPRSEIISVLIYDRTSDELASSDAKTAGNVEAAVVDRAVGLLGIWAFASTPIKGFSYNPVTKVYTATVAVSDDVTASVGTNWEQATQVELRKKVARQWMLTAAWTPAGRDQEEVTSLVLQWENRF